MLFVEQFVFFFFWQFTDDLIDYVNVISVLCDLNLDCSDGYNRLQLEFENKSQRNQSIVSISISPQQYNSAIQIYFLKGEIRFHLILIRSRL